MKDLSDEELEDRWELFKRVLDSIPDNTATCIVCFQISPDHPAQISCSGNIEALETMGMKVPLMVSDWLSPPDEDIIVVLEDDEEDDEEE